MILWIFYRPVHHMTKDIIAQHSRIGDLTIFWFTDKYIYVYIYITSLYVGPLYINIYQTLFFYIYSGRILHERGWCEYHVQLRNCKYWCNYSMKETWQKTVLCLAKTKATMRLSVIPTDMCPLWSCRELTDPKTTPPNADDFSPMSWLPWRFLLSLFSLPWQSHPPFSNFCHCVTYFTTATTATTISSLQTLFR